MHALLPAAFLHCNAVNRPAATPNRARTRRSSPAGPSTGAAGSGPLLFSSSRNKTDSSTQRCDDAAATAAAGGRPEAGLRYSGAVLISAQW